MRNTPGSLKICRYLYVFLSCALTISVNARSAPAEELVTLQSRPGVTVYDADLHRIPTPVLLVHHKDDGCRVTSAADIPGIAAKLRAAATVKTLFFEGGREDHHNPCRAMTRHGFPGIEGKVVTAIADWIANGAISR